MCQSGKNSEMCRTAGTPEQGWEPVDGCTIGSKKFKKVSHSDKSMFLLNDSDGRV